MYSSRRNKAGVVGDEILTILEDIEVAENGFEAAIEEALEDEQSELRANTADAERRTTIANVLTWTFGVVSLALVSGIGFVLNRNATRQLQAQKELAQTEAELAAAQEADKFKSQFLASMSHELRTPLNGVLSLSKYMQQGVFGDVNDEQSDYLGKIIDSGDHLLSLINDVLDVTKIQSGNLKLFVEEGFDVAEEISQIAASAEKMLDGKPVDLQLDVDPTLPLLTCDKRRVRQIYYNLVSNAIKFTEQGTITIRANQNNGELWFSVVDTGPGIASKDHETIFDPFVQTETGIQHAGGTGLGLAHRTGTGDSTWWTSVGGERTC